MDAAPLITLPSTISASPNEQLVRVFLICTGVDVFNRGIESFARECFDGLHGRHGLDFTLLKASGPATPDERVIPCLRRTGVLAKCLGRMIKRSPYTVEQLSSFLPVIREIRRSRPHVVYTSEANLAFQLHRWRRQIGVPFRLLLSNGAPLTPPFDRVDYVHHVTPVHRALALAAGENPLRHYMVPYGIRVPSSYPWVDSRSKISIRRRLLLPEQQKIILSVGHIGRHHKRMDTLVAEIARIPSVRRPYLVMLGNITAESAEVIHQAQEQLGAPGFTVRSVPYTHVWPYYQAADIFVLCSRTEGFGRVFLEALLYGLPIVAHDHPVMRFVLRNHAFMINMDIPGSTAAALEQSLAVPPAEQDRITKFNHVRDNFGWDALASQYMQMFQRVAQGPLFSKSS